MSGPDAQSMKTMMTKARVALEQIEIWLVVRIAV
jgi:hypothetical protein